MLDHISIKVLDGDIIIGSPLDGDKNLSLLALNGKVVLQDPVGAIKPLSGLEIIAKNGLFIQNPIHTTTNGIVINSDVTLLNNIIAATTSGDFIFNSIIQDLTNDYELSLQSVTGSISIKDVNLSSISFETQEGSLILNGNITLKSPFQTSGVGKNITVMGDTSIQTIGNNVNFNNIVSLNGNLNISTGDDQGSILFNDKIDGNYDLILKAPNITFNESLGSTDLLGNITIQSAENIDINKKIKTFKNLSIDSSSNVNIKDDITANGNVLFNDSEKVNLSGNIETIDNGSYIKSENTEIVLNKDASFKTNNGNIEIDALKTDSNYSAVIDLQKGNAKLGSVFLNKLEINNASNVELTKGDIKTTGNISIKSDIISINTNMYADSIILESPLLNVQSESLDNIILSGLENISFINDNININSSTTMKSNNDIIINPIMNIADSLSIEAKNIEIKSKVYGKELNIKNTENCILKDTLNLDKSLSIENQGTLYIKDKIITKGNMAFSGSGDIYLDADLESLNPEAFISVSDSKLYLSNNRKLQTLNGNITLNSVVTSPESEYELVINTGTGDLNINGGIGSKESLLGNLKIEQADNIYFRSENESINTRNIEINNTGKLFIETDILSYGSLNLDSIESVYLGANIETINENAVVNVNNSNIILTDNTSIKTNNGNIILDDITIDPDSDSILTLNSGTSDINMKNFGENDSKKGGLVIEESNNINISGNIFANGDIDLKANTINIDSDIISENGGFQVNSSSDANIKGEIKTFDSIKFIGTGDVYLSNNITSENDHSSIEIDKSEIFINNDITFKTNNGDIALGQIIPQSSSTFDVSLFSGQGNIDIKGKAGQDDLRLANFIIESSGDVILRDKLFTSKDINISSQNLSINSDVENSGMLEITTGQTAIIAGNIKSSYGILFNKPGEIILHGNLETLNPGAKIDIKSTLIQTNDHEIKTNNGDINIFSMLSQASQDSKLNLNAGDGDIIFESGIGSSTHSVSNLNIESANNVYFSGINDFLYLNKDMSIANDGSLIIDSRVYMSGDINIASKNVSINNSINSLSNNTESNNTLKINTLDDIYIKEIASAKSTDIEMVSETGNLNFGNIDAGQYGNIMLKTTGSINDGSIKGYNANITADTIGLISPPFVDVKNININLTNTDKKAIVGKIIPGNSVNISSQTINIPEMAVFIFEGFQAYGLQERDNLATYIPGISYNMYDKILRHSFDQGFFTIPPIHIDMDYDE